MTRASSSAGMSRSARRLSRIARPRAGLRGSGWKRPARPCSLGSALFVWTLGTATRRAGGGRWGGGGGGGGGGRGGRVRRRAAGKRTGRGGGRGTAVPVVSRNGEAYRFSQATRGNQVNERRWS